MGGANLTPSMHLYGGCHSLFLFCREEHPVRCMHGLAQVFEAELGSVFLKDYQCPGVRRHPAASTCTFHIAGTPKKCVDLCRYIYISGGGDGRSKEAMALPPHLQENTIL